MSGINKVTGSGPYNRFNGQQSSGGWSGGQHKQNKQGNTTFGLDLNNGYQSESQQYGYGYNPIRPAVKVEYGKNDYGSTALDYYKRYMHDYSGAQMDVYDGTGVGSHIGASFSPQFAGSSADRYMYDKLLAAYQHPGSYQSLTLQIAGRAYNFTSLPRAEQEAILRLIRQRI